MPDFQGLRLLVVGASRGIGAAGASHLVGAGHEVIAVSRSPSAHGRWVQADVATDSGLDQVVAGVGPGPLDALLYLGGTWERGAFTADYDFAASPRDETRAVLAVNLTAPILLAQALANRLAAAPNPRIILIGALSGRANAATVEVANTAAKFGLSGAAQALTIALRPQGIGVTVINPGYVATPEVEADIADGRFGDQAPIPMADLMATIDFVLAQSALAVPVTIDLAQKRGG